MDEQIGNQINKAADSPMPVPSPLIHKNNFSLVWKLVLLVLLVSAAGLIFYSLKGQPSSDVKNFDNGKSAEQEKPKLSDLKPGSIVPDELVPLDLALKADREAIEKTIQFNIPKSSISSKAIDAQLLPQALRNLIFSGAGQSKVFEVQFTQQLSGFVLEYELKGMTVPDLHTQISEYLKVAANGQWKYADAYLGNIISFWQYQNQQYYANIYATATAAGSKVYKVEVFVLKK